MGGPPKICRKLPLSVEPVGQRNIAGLGGLPWKCVYTYIYIYMYVYLVVSQNNVTPVSTQNYYNPYLGDSKNDTPNFGKPPKYEDCKCLGFSGTVLAVVQASRGGFSLESSGTQHSK